MKIKIILIIFLITISIASALFLKEEDFNLLVIAKEPLSWNLTSFNTTLIQNSTQQFNFTIENFASINYNILITYNETFNQNLTNYTIDLPKNYTISNGNFTFDINFNTLEGNDTFIEAKIEVMRI